MTSSRKVNGLLCGYPKHHSDINVKYFDSIFINNLLVKFQLSSEITDFLKFEYIITCTRDHFGSQYSLKISVHVY